MTQFEKPSFTVKTGSRDPKGCEHTWIRAARRGVECVTCGQPFTADQYARYLETGEVP